jgi:hypothetical protein
MSYSIGNRPLHKSVLKLQTLYLAVVTADS